MSLKRDRRGRRGVGPRLQVWRGGTSSSEPLEAYVSEVVMNVCSSAQAIDSVIACRALRAALRDAEIKHAQYARADGLSWVQIGAALGMTRAGARKRYSATIRDPQTPDS